MKTQQLKFLFLASTLFLGVSLNVMAQVSPQGRATSNKSYNATTNGCKDDVTNAPCWSWTVDNDNNDYNGIAGFKWWNNGGNTVSDLVMQMVTQPWGYSLEVPSPDHNSILSLIANDSRMTLHENRVYPFMFFQTGDARTGIFYGKDHFMNFTLNPKVPTNSSTFSYADGFRFLDSQGADIVNNPDSYGRELMRITKNGLVGIGTSKPACRLHVKGGFMIESVENEWVKNSFKVNVSSSRVVLTSTGEDEGMFLESKTGNKITIGDFDDDVIISANNIICSNNTSTDNVFMSINTVRQVEHATLTVAGATYIGPKADLAADGRLSKFNPKYLAKYSLWVEKGIVSEDFAFAGVDRWQDGVFNADYDLLPLEQVKSYIDQNKHLPNVPSEKSIKENGYTAHQMNMIFMQKIEELTLYTISLKEEIEEMKKERVNNKE
ncbi:hypothetical protein [Flavobacterium sp. CAU 1735]|uniref:hypothetical protein n=1 Tax=Flavobacterium sp. CAU 1735 TaxID=3140361 RepID=UPI003260E900